MMATMPPVERLTEFPELSPEAPSALPSAVGASVP